MFIYKDNDLRIEWAAAAAANAPVEKNWNKRKMHFLYLNYKHENPFSSMCYF